MTGWPLPEAEPLCWTGPPRRPRLPPGEVHLWLVSLAAAPAQVEPLLSPDEYARASRFRFAEGRRRFAAGRAALRRILASYLEVPPASLVFETNAYGRPSLAGRAPEDRLHFNLSHAGELMILAVGSWPEIGVDVERPRDDVAILDIAGRMFAPEEFRALAALPRASQRPAFYACWTRKEAFVKACGEGLSRPLNSFVVSVGEPAALLRTKGEPLEAPCWTLLGFVPAPGYIAALATRAIGVRLCCWREPLL